MTTLAHEVTIGLDDARALVHDALVASGLDPSDAAVATRHLIDCELRGLGYGGLARALTITERLVASGLPARPWSVVAETAVSATIDGADHLGYVVAQRATDLAVAKARSHGIGVVAAHDTWYTGMFSWYLEAVTSAGLVGMAAGNAGTTVAPHGASEPLLGTNPIGFGFPSTDAPVIWDTGTSAITHAEVVLAGRVGASLPDGVAFGPDGSPTTSPAAALDGALAVWGGHRGSGLSLSVHLLGMLAGSPAVPRRPGAADLGFLAWAVDPGLLGDADAFRRAVAEHADRIRNASPVDPERAVRVPFDRSRARREQSLRRGTLDVDARVVDALRALTSA